MTTQSFSVSALIPAPPARVCGIIADYHHGHPRILPKPAFESLVVEPGGLGAGTVVRVQMRLLAQRQAFRATVTEPASGRVLVETNHTGYITTFTVVPRANGEHAQVTFSSETPARPGVLAIFERWLVRQLLRPVYRKALALLAKVAADAARSDPSTFKPGNIMLELRPTCEHCNRPLPPESPDARICSYECTFCATCVDTVLANTCPNCGGGFQPRPIRPARHWKNNNYLGADPASTTVQHRPVNLEAHARLLAAQAGLLPEKR